MRLSLAQYMQKEDGNAEASVRKALEIANKILVSNHPAKAGALRILALLCAYEGNLDRAEQLLKQVVDIRTKAYDIDDVSVIDAQRTLA